MTFNKFAPLALGGVLLTGLMTTAAAAQQPPPAAAPGQPRGEWRRPDPEAMAARRAEHLRAALQLRPDQEPALKAFLDAGRPAQPPARADREAIAKLPTPQRLDAQRARMTERLARFDQRAAATKRFYAQLNPAQQKAFDALAPRGHGKGMGKGGHRGMGGPMGRGG
ncbi:Spy/CpxP family protein refolding chaperone [Phenylobacterium sp.]|uniref:Spy/CpxP family protein refolding chaperone n=1 Tax=Phenylobacterium sp. TaxID=1871053 RepID=UPI0028A29D97|nr:Spy/CpxP family protein refolding chaperone [Phenylobacterium sp.]